MYLHKTKNGHYTPPCCYFSGELEVVECLPQTFSGGFRYTKYPHDAILWRFARMDHALALLNYPVIDFRRHGDNATSEAIWTKESRIQTFDVYIYFHKMAIERVTSGEDKKILLTGINVLEKRKRFLETGNILIWIELIIKYHAFYNSIKGCLTSRQRNSSGRYRSNSSSPHFTSLFFMESFRKSLWSSGRTGS